jgi:hypothetical protein
MGVPTGKDKVPQTQDLAERARRAELVEPFATHWLRIAAAMAPD